MEHGVISFLISVLLSFILFDYSIGPELVVLIIFGTITGVLIDLDHFLIARINNGNWNILRKALRNPVTISRDWSEFIHPTKDIPPEQRLASHLVLIPAISLITYYFSPSSGIFISVILATHLVCDIYADIRLGLVDRYLPV